MTVHTPTRAASVGCFVAALLLPVSPMGIAAQGIPTTEITSRFQVGFFGGYLSHSLLGEVTGTLTTAIDDVIVSMDVEAEATNLIGGLIGWRLSNAAAVRIRAARSGTHVRLIVQATPIGGFGAQRFTFGGLGDVETWLADAELSWRPFGTETIATPYVVVGVGVSQWDITGLEDLGSLPPLLETPVNLIPVNATLPAVTLAAGVSYSPTDAFTVELELTDHISGNPLADDDFRLGTSFTGFGGAKDLVHSVSLSVGLHVNLGG
jgi:hypothetical protein